MEKIIKGKVSVGVAHPLYGKEVDLIVVKENAGYDGRQTFVKTVYPVRFTNRHANVFVGDQYIGSKGLPDESRIVEGWLEK